MRTCQFPFIFPLFSYPPFRLASSLSLPSAVGRSRSWLSFQCILTSFVCLCRFTYLILTSPSGHMSVERCRLLASNFPWLFVSLFATFVFLSSIPYFPIQLMFLFALSMFCLLTLQPLLDQSGIPISLWLSLLSYHLFEQDMSDLFPACSSISPSDSRQGQISGTFVLCLLILLSLFHPIRTHMLHFLYCLPLSPIVRWRLS